MPAIPIDLVQKILPVEKQQEINDAIFGPKPSQYEQAAAVRDQRFQDWLNSRKQALEQQRTDDVRMARLNALGNVLTTMVQPLGWAIGGKGSGVTGGVQPIDNRQYLQAFDRAQKASNELRNIGTMEGEYQFKLAEDEYQRQQAIADYERKARMQAQIQQDYAQARHDYTMAEIDARGDYQKAVAEIRAKNRITKNGKSADDQNLKTAYTEYRRYLRRYWDQVGVGIQRTEKSGPLTFEQFLGTPEGGGYAIEPVAKQDKTPAATKPEKKGGFQTGASSQTGTTSGGKKGGFKI